MVVEGVEPFAGALIRLLDNEVMRLELETPDHGKLDRHTWMHAAACQMEVYRGFIGRRRGRDA